MIGADPLHRSLTLSERYPVGSTFETSDSGTPLKILGPDRKPVVEVKTDDEVVTIPVPAGTDGQCWSFAPHRCKKAGPPS